MLLLPSVRPQDAGTYVCTASNRQGKVKAFAQLQVPGETAHPYPCPAGGAAAPCPPPGGSVVSNCAFCLQSEWYPTSRRPPTPSCRCPPSRTPTGSLRSRSPSGQTLRMVSRGSGVDAGDLRGPCQRGTSPGSCWSSDRPPRSQGPQACWAPPLWLSPPPCFSIRFSEMPAPKPPASKSATDAAAPALLPHLPPPASAPSSLLPPSPFPPLSLSLSSVSSLLLWVSDLHCPGLLLYSGESLCFPLLLQVTLPRKWSKFSFFLGTLSKALLSRAPS